MEQRPARKRPEDFAINMAVRAPKRRPAGFRFLGWGMITVCALGMALVLAANPKVQQQMATLTESLPTPGTVEFTALPDAAPSISASSDFDTQGDVLMAPVRAAASFGALTRSARKAFGMGSVTDHIEEPDIEYIFPDSEDQPSPEFAQPEPGHRPAVRVLPTSKVPVRRAGVSVGN
ncbi:MAG: hypothetical protein ACU0BB_08865 [Paracoccaceae bacterium]